MALTKAQLKDIALTLENDGEFYEAYKKVEASASERREMIAQFMLSTSYLRGKYRRAATAKTPDRHEKTDREQLRLYFDEQWNLTPAILGVCTKDRVDFMSDDPTTEEQWHADFPGCRTISTTTYDRIFPKEATMTTTNASAIDITTKTLVNGVDIATLSDAAVYDMIAAQEGVITYLEGIKTKPKMLLAEIEKRQAGIGALVAYLDSKVDSK